MRLRSFYSLVLIVFSVVISSCQSDETKVDGSNDSPTSVQKVENPEAIKKREKVEYFKRMQKALHLMPKEQEAIEFIEKDFDRKATKLLLDRPAGFQQDIMALKRKKAENLKTVLRLSGRIDF